MAGNINLKEKACEYIKKFDVVRLTESRVEERNNSLWGNILRDFEYREKPAVREFKKGRAKEGVKMVIKKGKREIEITWGEDKTKEMISVEIKIGEDKMKAGLIYMREETRKNWEEIARIKEEARDGRIIIGDFRKNRERRRMGKQRERERYNKREEKNRYINEEGKKDDRKLGRVRDVYNKR